MPRLRGEVLIRSENKTAPAIKSPERLLKAVIAAKLANAGAQETPVVVHAHLAAGEKIGYCRDRLPVAVRAGADRQNQITQGKPGTSLQNLPISFHLVSVFSQSSSRAIPNCEYLIHKSHAVIHTLLTLELTAERHFCSIFKHKSFAHCGIGIPAHGSAGRRYHEDYELKTPTLSEQCRPGLNGSAKRPSGTSLFTGQPHNQQVKTSDRNACDHDGVKITALLHCSNQSRRIL